MHIPGLLNPRRVIGMLVTLSMLALSPATSAAQQPARPGPPYTTEQLNEFLGQLYGVDPTAVDEFMRGGRRVVEVEYLKRTVLPELALVGVLEVASRKQQGRFLSIAELAQTKRMRFAESGRWGAYDFVVTTISRDTFEIVARAERDSMTESEIAKARPLSVSIREDLKLRAAEYGSRQWVVIYDVGAALLKAGYDPTAADIRPLDHSPVELKGMANDEQVVEVLTHLYRAQKEYNRRYHRYAQDELDFMMNQIKVPRFGNDRFDGTGRNHLERLGYSLQFFTSTQWEFVIAARPIKSPYGTKSATKRALIVCGDGYIRDEMTKAVVADVR